VARRDEAGFVGEHDGMDAVPQVDVLVLAVRPSLYDELIQSTSGGRRV
jgi:hypothetical protein